MDIFVGHDLGIGLTGVVTTRSPRFGRWRRIGAGLRWSNARGCRLTHVEEGAENMRLENSSLRVI
jgi:hypothetical protein